MWVDSHMNNRVPTCFYDSLHGAQRQAIGHGVAQRDTSSRLLYKFYDYLSQINGDMFL